MNKSRYSLIHLSIPTYKIINGLDKNSTDKVLPRGVATHFWLGGRISAVSFGSNQWKDMCFYGTDKYVTWLRSIYYRHDNRKIVMKLERVKVETVKKVTI